MPARTRSRRPPIDSDLFLALPTVADPSMRPDGGEIAFVRSEVDRDTRESRSQIRAVAAVPRPRRRAL